MRNEELGKKKEEEIKTAKHTKSTKMNFFAYFALFAVYLSLPVKGKKKNEK